MMLTQLQQVLSLILPTSTSLSSSSSILCQPSTFSPTLYGAKILDIAASPVLNYSLTATDNINFNHPTVNVVNANFCNVTVTYTHPGQNDTINVEIWLPDAQHYNGRLQSLGGGGWAAGRFIISYYGMSAAIGEGYAAATTDAGLVPFSGLFSQSVSLDPSSYALLSPGNVNLFSLMNLASQSLYDQAILAKAVIKDYYGQVPQYSYWSGCSQGGRQGLMLAQRYPDLYDGIAASAPANNWNEMIPALHYTQVMMEQLGEFPRGCELDFVAAEAIKACDGADGVVDGLIADMDSCTFDPFTLVNTTFLCDSTGTTMKLSEGAATISNLTWTGPRDTDGAFMWYGFSPGSAISGSAMGGSVAMTNCSNSTCTGAPLGLGTQWIQLFVEKNPDLDLSNMKLSDLQRYVHKSIQRYDSIIGTNDADLREFRNAGGKLLSYHGEADPIIPPKGTEHYYKAVTEITPDVHEFYRYYKVPGLQHCTGGNGGQPTMIFDAMRAWVENGTVPEGLHIEIKRGNATLSRKLCPYPQKAVYDGQGDSDSAESFSCV